MKILVTGGAGFIGSWTCETLLSQGHEVICVDNFNDYYDPKQKERNIEKIVNNPNFTLFRADIRNFDFLKDIFLKNKPDKVIHLAAMAGVRNSIDNPKIYVDVNVNGTINILELAKEFNVKNVVYASSSSVYGNNKKTPFSEIDNVDYPISSYAATKKSGELLCHTYNNLHDINIACLRFFTVYGPRGRPDMAPFIFTKNISEENPINVFLLNQNVLRFNDSKSSKRDYTYITDIVDGIIASLDVKGYEIINLGNNRPIELNYFISLIEQNVGKKAQKIEKPMQPGDVEITYADISKAQKLLGYNPKVPIEEGLKKFVEWYKNERVIK